VDQVSFYTMSTTDEQSGSMIHGPALRADKKRYPCSSPWLSAVIFPDGEVSLCCKTMWEVGSKPVVSMGNVNEQLFEDIWRGDKYTAFRRALVKGQMPGPCTDCTIWSSSKYQKAKTGQFTRTWNQTMETYAR